MFTSYFMYPPYEEDGFIALRAVCPTRFKYKWWQTDVLAVGDADIAEERFRLFDGNGVVCERILRIDLNTAKHQHQVERPSIPPLSRFTMTEFFRIVGGPYADDSVWTVETLSVVGKLVESPVLDPAT